MTTLKFWHQHLLEVADPLLRRPCVTGTSSASITPRPAAAPCNQLEPRCEPPSLGTILHRTSILEVPTVLPLRCSQDDIVVSLRRVSSNLRGSRLSAHTMDAIDIALPGIRYYGCLIVPLYHRSRPHLSLDKDSPDPRPVQSVGIVIAIPEVGGL